MPNMSRKNVTINVTVYSSMPPTHVPQELLPVGRETTHFVDIIEVSMGDASVTNQIYLEGIFVPNSNVFIFADSAVNRIAEQFNQTFPNCSYQMKGLVERAVALTICS